MKVIVIGLDGASWIPLENWIARGELPNLRRIREQGSWGRLRSCLPPVTSPNWKCYATGTNPGKLGVFWWEIVDFERGEIITPRSTSFTGTELWDYLGESGKRVGIVNMPTCYPPRPVNGFMIAGGPDALESGFCHPPELERRLTERGYRILPERIAFLPDRDRRAIDEVLELIELRFQLGQELLEEFDLDLLHLTIYLINVLQHHFGDAPRVLEAWKLIDRGIGNCLKRFDDVTVFLMSDHGTNRIRCKFNVNTWLASEGYLVVKKRPAKELLFKLGVHKDSVSRLLTRLGLKDLVKRKLSQSVRNILPTETGAVMSAGKAVLIDWERTQAYGLGQGPIHLSPHLSNRERDLLREEIKRKLNELACDGGRKIARAVHTKEEIYHGPYLERAPDLIIDQNDGIHISNSIGFRSVFELPGRWKGENARIGLFAAWGSGIRTGRLDRDVEITDLAPTILHLMGEAVSEEMDGRVLTEIFTDGSDPHAREVRYQNRTDELERGKQGPARETDRQVESRLKDLGYLG
ncbi:MAG: alkaline phosphatase family protein [Candidatus Bipolaricaulia bacterium]